MHEAEAFLPYIHGTAEVALGAAEVTLFVGKFSEIVQYLGHAPGIRARFLTKLECVAIVFQRHGSVFLCTRYLSKRDQTLGSMKRIRGYLLLHIQRSVIIGARSVELTLSQ